MIAYFGVFSPDEFYPERCTGPAGLDCIDKALIKNNRISFSLMNNQGFDIRIEGLGESLEGDCGIGEIEDVLIKESSEIGLVPNGQVFTVRVICQSLPKEKVKANIPLQYTNVETNLEHTARIAITGVNTP